MLALNTTLQSRYRIVRQLGQGGMGTVYEAKALRLNTTVALKETHFTDERLRKQFEREAQLLAGLCHPALPRVIDHFNEGDGLYLVMDYVKGDDLWELLKKRGVPFKAMEVFAWAGQLLNVLSYLHTQNPPVIHRDIKLQNLKLTEEGKIILLDFGLAKGLNDSALGLLTSKTVIGFSLPYAPLEKILQVDETWREHLSVVNPQEVQRLSHLGTDCRSDLYSVGATLLHLLTAKIPTNSPTRAISVWSRQPDPLESVLAKGVSNRFWPFFGSSMALDPAHRFCSAEEMGAALRNSLEGSYEDSVLSSQFTRAEKPASVDNVNRGRHFRVLAVIAAISIITIFAALYLTANKIKGGAVNILQQPTVTPPVQTGMPIKPRAEGASVSSTYEAPVNSPAPTPLQPKKAIGNDYRGDMSEDINSIDEEIKQLEEKKAALLITYKRERPEVKEIDRQIADLQIKRAALIELEK